MFTSGTHSPWNKIEEPKVVFLLPQVWRFSTAFSPVRSWHFCDVPSMSDHLRTCRFNTVEHKTEPVPLPAMCTGRGVQSLRCVLRHIST